MAARKAQISLAKPIISTMSIRITGASPLIVQQWHVYPRPVDMENPVRPKPQNPVQDFMESLYWLTPMPEEFTEAAYAAALAAGAKFGFPANGLKQSAVNAAHHAGKVKDKVSLYGAFIVDGGDLVEIQGTPVIRKDDIIIGSGPMTKPLYRGEFPEWAMEFGIKYNVAVVSPEQITEYFAIAGAVLGIGAWRPEKGGVYGKFTVA